MPQQFRVHMVHYSPKGEPVTIAVEAIGGPFAGRIHDLHTTQEELQALCIGKGVWGDPEIMAEAGRLLNEQGVELESDQAAA